jgi:hypothetical protein
VASHLVSYPWKPHLQVINALAPHIVQLSMHKFASNVVEKCLALGAPADRSMLVKLMLGSDQAGVPRDGEAQADGPEVGAWRLVGPQLLASCESSS